MKTVEEVRRERLKMLKKEFGTWSVLNEKLKLDVRDSTLSQYHNQHKGKGMGSPMARRLEQACGKEVGWMDTDPALTGEVGDQRAAKEFQQLRERLRAEVLAEMKLAERPLTPEEERQAQQFEHDPRKQNGGSALRPSTKGFPTPPKG